MIEAVSERPLLVDAVLAALVGIVSVAAALGGESHSDTALRSLDAGGIALLLAASATLVWRRRAPLLVFGANIALLGTYLALGYTEDYTGYSVFAAVLTVASRRSLRTALAVGSACIAMVFILREPHFGFELLNVVQISAIVFAVFLGAYLRARRAYLESGEERAELEREDAELREERAVLDERGRIARELHDMVAHAMSVVSLQIGGARLTMTRDPARSDEALARAERASREALSELRRLLGVLQPGDETAAGLSPQPAVSDIAALLENARTAGLRIDQRVEGEPRPLGPVVELSAFRIVQESVTNALRHAGPGAEALVVLRYGPAWVEVEVTNTGSSLRPPSAAAGEPRGGRGLIGMRERAAMLGGELSAGPLPDGGFRVSAHLPAEPLEPEPGPTATG